MSLLTRDMSVDADREPPFRSRASALSDVGHDASSRGGTTRVAAGGVLSIFAFWISLPLLVGALLLLFAEEVRFGQGLRFIGAATVFSVSWTGVTVVVFRLTSRFGLESSDRLTRNLVLVGAGILLAALVTGLGIAGFLLFGLGPADEAGPVPLRMIAGRMLLPNLLIYGGIALAGLARDASLRAQSRREEAVQLHARNAQLHAQLAEARLRVLHTQLNPHFLFNTLNAVSGLMDEDPRGARRMIARLSELLRYALKEGTDAEIPLHDELKLVGRYLEIVEIRFQGRLETSVTSDPAAREALVPSLILQPLAENAMKHGVGKAGGYGRIEVQATRAGDSLVLRVLDTGAGAAADAAPNAESGGGGLGLRHTRERLDELYGADQGFTLTPRAEGGMVAEIVLPYHTVPFARPGRETGQA
jgi:two-component system, LytTR family, sensor kinase